MSPWHNMNHVLGLSADETVFLHADWPAPQNVHTLISTRRGGVSQGAYASLNVGAHVGDDVAAVRQNRALVQQHISHPVAYLTQVHGTTVVAAGDAVAAGRRAQVLEADASVAHIGDAAACAVMTADCLPVLLCDQQGTVVAAAHAGWRGLAGGIVEQTIIRMAVPPSTIIAYLGPAIGADAFEVGQDVRTAFCAAHPSAAAAFHAIGADKYLADLYLLARLALKQAGVEHVYGGEYCTVLDRARFYSYRRDGQTGRMVSAIWLS